MKHIITNIHYLSAHLLIFAAALLSGQNAHADTQVDTLYWESTLSSANEITFSSGYTLKIINPEDKKWAKGGGEVTLNGKKFLTFKNANGRENRLFAPSGRNIVSVTFYAVSNDAASTSYLKKFEDTTYGKSDYVVSSLQDYENPTVISKTLSTPADSLSFTFANKQVCLIVLVTSSSTITPSDPPTIESDLKSTESVTVGVATDFAISATDAESYQWYTADDASGTNPQEISGATTASYSYTAASEGTIYLYCNVTNAAGSIKSTICAVTASKALVFRAKDANSKVIDSKFTTQNLYVTVGDTTGLTFKVNGTVTYHGDSGITITEKTGTKTNNTYVVTAWKGSNKLLENTYTYIPTIAGVSSYKSLEDGTEAILKMTNQKVTYIKSDSTEVYFNDNSKGIQGYKLGLKNLTAYKTANGSIWGVKKTVAGISQIAATDSTSSCSSVTQTTTDVTPIAISIAQTLTADKLLVYGKIAGAKIVNEGGSYYATMASNKVIFSDRFNSGLIDTLGKKSTPVYADVTCIIGTDGSANQLWPLTLENIANETTGVSGGVSWKIDLEGNMLFYPTDGVSGTLAKTGITASTRSWDAGKEHVKAVKFDAGVSANTEISYMFYNMSNLESVDFTNFIIPESTVKINGLFDGCSKLKSVDMSAYDLGAITATKAAFYECFALESVNFGENSFPEVTDFSTMFGSCSSLKRLDFSKVTGAKVTNVASMLSGCTALKSVDFRNFSTEQCTKSSNIQSLFANTMPDTLYLNKNFGPIASVKSFSAGLGVKANLFVELPQKHYMAVDSTGARLGYDFDLSNTQNYQINLTQLYAYNTSLDSYGIYVTYQQGSDFDESTVTKADLTALKGTSGSFRIKRTLYKDGGDNTICLPFSLTAEQLAASPLANYTKLQVFTSATVKNKGAENETLALTMKDTTGIKAGKPFVIAWASGDDIVNPLFSDVTIDADEGEVNEDQANGVKFCGTLVPLAQNANDKNIMFIDSDGSLKWPEESGNIKAFRCYFQIIPEN